MSRCASRLCPATFSSTLPVGYAAPPLARLGGLSRSRPSLGPAPAPQQWPQTKRPATGTLGRGLWRSLLWDLGPGVGAEAAVKSWPQRKGALGHTHADRRGARTHRPTADRRAWAGSGVLGAAPAAGLWQWELQRPARGALWGWAARRLVPAYSGELPEAPSAT